VNTLPTLPPEDRVRLWADALDYLAEPDRTKELIEVLNHGDRAQLEALLEPTRILQTGGCIEGVEILIGVIHHGGWHFEEKCSLVFKPRPIDPGYATGKYYRLPDGTYAWFSDAHWWEYFDRAASDLEWRKEHKDLLVALGILVCETRRVPNDEIVTAEKKYRFCFPTVIDPFD
jgi:hypothetical protein